MGGLDHLFVDCLQDVDGCRNLAEQIQAADSGEGDEGTGIRPEPGSPARAFSLA